MEEKIMTAITKSRPKHKALLHKNMRLHMPNNLKKTKKAALHYAKQNPITTVSFGVIATLVSGLLITYILKK